MDRLGWRWMVAIVGLSVLTLIPGIGGGSRLTYHEAFVAQGAREMIRAGAWLVPTIDGQPWVEKPPLVHWLVILVASIAGDVTEWAARVPSAVAAVGLSLAVAVLASRRFGVTIGGLAGCVQSTTAWTVIRGRLAESDVVLACLVAWAFVMLDRVRLESEDSRRKVWLGRGFLLLVGVTSLVKGIGFGAVLIGVATALILVWDRDWPTFRAVLDPLGLAIAALVALGWPVAVAIRHPEALRLWTTHIADRMANRPEVFAGRSPWWFYLPVILGLTMPWTLLAIGGARRSVARACRDRGGIDRLLLAWAVGPAVLLSMATVKNAHYVIHALAPWSVWTAVGLVRLGGWLEARGRSPRGMQRRLALLFVVIAAGFGLGFAAVAPRLDRHGVEWGFYEAIAGRLDRSEPLVFLYDDWDRLPYPTPFGPIPHDLAVRLYYLNRPASWRQGLGQWPDLPDRPFLTVARDRDLPGLGKVGRVDRLVSGPTVRWDRTYSLYRVTPTAPDRDTSVIQASAP